MSFEDDKIVLTEIIVKENYELSGRKIMDINFPKTGTISCVYRKPSVIIPNGQTTIYPNDKLLSSLLLRNKKTLSSSYKKKRKLCNNEKAS